MVREMAGLRPDGGSIMIMVVKNNITTATNAVYLGIKHIRTLATSPTIDPTVCSGGGPSWPPQWVSGSLPELGEGDVVRYRSGGSPSLFRSLVSSMRIRYIGISMV